MMMLFTYILITCALTVRVTGNEVVIGVLGNSVSLECGLPLSSTLIWEDSDGIVLAMHGVVANSLIHKYVVERRNNVHELLIIHNISLTDEKMYRCYDLTNKTVFEISNVTVLVQPPVMRVSYPREPVLEGTEVTLICEVDGSKPLPLIKWHRIDSKNVTTEVLSVSHDTLYTNGTGYRRSTTVINVTRDTYMTSYVCDISVAVFYHKSLTLDLDVQLKPLPPVINGYSGAYDTGKNLSIECTSTGSNPAATVFWILDDVRVGDYEFVVIPEGNGLFTVKSYFRRIMPANHNGSVLTCAVTNSVLENQGLPPQMTKINLLESFKPRIVIAMSNHTSMEGGNVTLECLVEARPNPNPDSLVWYRDNTVLDSSKYTITQQSGVFQLHITNLTRSDAGDYMCGASNRVGESYSAATTLKVLYVPVCSTTAIEKHAINVGDILRLRCQMDAVPGNVTMQWLYSDTGIFIQSGQSKLDINTGYSYGSLDVVISSSLQTMMIDCYGNNAVGHGHIPCKYHLVAPGAPDPPVNCSSVTSGSSVKVICQAGFNGGSTQLFMLYDLEENGYQPVANRSLPVFQITRNKNTTIKVCAVNEDFHDVPSCAEAITIGVHQSDIPSSQAVTTKKPTNTTAFIAGGTVAFVGILIITIIVIVICRRKKHSQPVPLPSSLKDLKITTTTTNDQNNSTKWPKLLWQRIMRPSGKKQDGTCTQRRGKIVTRTGDSDDDDVTYQTIEVIASTPHYPSKQHRLNLNESNTSFLRQFVGDYRPKTDQDGNLMILNASTGISLSPISIHSESSRMSCLVDDYRTRDDHTEAVTGVTGDAYRTTDIKDVLGDLTTKLEFTNDREDGHTVDTGLVTRLKDYSAGDILEVLDSSKTNTNRNVQDTMQLTLPSYEESLAFTFLQYPNRKRTVSNDFSKHNMYTEEPSYSSSSRVNCISDSKRELLKAYSLPYRTKTKSSRVVKISSVSNIHTLSSNSNPYTSRPSVNLPIEIDIGTDSVSFSCARAHGATTRSSTVSNTDSVFTGTDETAHDIDEFTLTAASDSSVECYDTDLDHDDEPIAYICVMGGHDVDEESSNKHEVRQVLRRNSFLSAVSNDQCYSVGNDGEYMLPSLFSESEHIYVNEGLDLRDPDKIECATIDKMCSSRRNSDNQSVNVVAYF